MKFFQENLIGSAIKFEYVINKIKKSLFSNSFTSLGFINNEDKIVEVTKEILKI